MFPISLREIVCLLLIFSLLNYKFCQIEQKKGVNAGNIWVLKAFFERYYEQSPQILANKDAALLLSYSLIVLNIA